MLEVQRYLAKKSIIDLQREFSIKVKPHQKYLNLVALAYDQIKSPMHRSIVQECRGLVIDTADNNRVVSMAYKKFWNYGEVHGDNLNLDTTRLYEKLDGCLKADTRLNTWNGEIVTINDVVNKGARPTLVGVDENGNVVPAEITNAFKNGTKNRWLRFTLTRNSKTGRQRSKQKLVCTFNHEVFCNGEFKPASEVTIGDSLTTYSETINSFLLDYITGGLLGDGCICDNKYQEGHTSAHQDYNSWIRTCLEPVLVKADTRISGYGTEMTRATTRVLDVFQNLREIWYPEGKKIVPKNLVLNDFIVAKWYMDDGSLSHSEKQNDRACFSTNSFTEEEVNFLGQQLNTLYGVSTTTYFNKGWNLRVNAGKNNEILNFWSAISKYIPEGMQYKLPENFRGLYDFVPNPETYFETTEVCVKDIECLLPIKANFPSGCQGYDIETSTHNYFASGLLVHNSMTCLYHYRGEWQVSTTGTPDASGECTLWGNSFASLFWHVFNELNYKLPKDTNYCYIFELCTSYNQVVVLHSQSKLVLHGVRNLADGCGGYELAPESAAEMLGLNYELVKIYDLPKNWPAITQFIREQEGKSFEGLVAVDHQFHRLKLKNAEYVFLHHSLSKFSLKHALEIIFTGEVSEVLTYKPEYQALFDDLLRTYNEIIFFSNQCLEQCRGWDRKTIGLWFADKPKDDVHGWAKSWVFSKLFDPTYELVSIEQGLLSWWNSKPSRVKRCFKVRPDLQQYLVGDEND